MSKQKKWIIILGSIALLVILVIALLLLKGKVPVISAGDVEQTGSQQTDNQGKEDQNGGNQADAPATTKPGETEPTTPGATEATKPGTTESTTPGATEATKPDETEPTKPTEPEGVTPPPSDLPPTVDIPVADEQTGLQFPCEVPGYDLRIEKLAPYSGMFVEDGSNAKVTDVAMLQVCNKSDYAVEYTEITVKYENDTLLFCITALPAGQTVVVQEKEGKSVPAGVAQEAKALVVQRVEMGIASELSVTDNGDHSLTIENLTDETLPAVRVFYKYYMKDEGLFVGGIAFTVRVTNLTAGEKITVSPSHYNSQTSCVVMAQVYDS